ncbi:PepSY-associated TM helix domain-containing protein [Marinomonas algarum]|uniref:PepSY-associated TM helix domain-containing protein n=1 Tax=Marinomonas algarum TaxID=2883105 RepID=A0A9X1IKV5_9GAMM|nr:PepSY-associated TM helix domain-containing protein [Marinomonas algarum]MCB5161075.1 PepSY-associated TM helix domain-containing protein [Marinomonas algarum]
MITFNRWARWLHIYSAAPVLLLMLFFAGTGLLLNHSNWAAGEIKNTDQRLTLPNSLTTLDWRLDPGITALSMFHWLDQAHQIRGVDFSFEWEEEEQLLLLYLDGPQGNYAIEAYYEEGIAEVYKTQLPFITMLNNLHRNKHVSGLWRWLSDIAAVCMALFCLSGFWLLVVNTLQRQHSLSWVGIGSVITILAMYLMH